MNEKDKKELKLITDTIKNTVKAEQIYLFGSYAYGTPTKDSDFDIYVVISDSEKRPIKVMQDINVAMIGLDIRSVDVLAGYRNDFIKRCEVPTLERTIMKKGVKIYEREVQLHQLI